MPTPVAKPNAYACCSIPLGHNNQHSDLYCRDYCNHYALFDFDAHFDPPADCNTYAPAYAISTWAAN